MFFIGESNCGFCNGCCKWCTDPYALYSGHNTMDTGFTDCSVEESPCTQQHVKMYVFVGGCDSGYKSRNNKNNSRLNPVLSIMSGLAKGVDNLGLKSHSSQPTMRALYRVQCLLFSRCQYGFHSLPEFAINACWLVGLSINKNMHKVTDRCWRGFVLLKNANLVADAGTP